MKWRCMVGGGGGGQVGGGGGLGYIGVVWGALGYFEV